MKTYPVNKTFRPAVLHAELQAAGVNVATVRTLTRIDESTSSSGQVVTDDAAVDAAVNAAIVAHNGAPTESERLDGAGVPPRVVACLLIRASTHWATLSADRRLRVQQAIDDAAAGAIAKLT